MPARTKSEHTEGRARELSPVSILSDWVRQGTESFFATQRILLDLVMRQNANTMQAVREQFANVRAAPGEILPEMAGEGISNFIAAQRVLLHLWQRQNEIVMTGVKERRGGFPPVAAVTDLISRGLDNFIDMQQHFLTIAARQADEWIDAAKEGKPFDGKGMAEMARDAMDTFVRSQKKFLDVLAEQTAVATGEPGGEAKKPAKKTELTELARQGAEAFIDAQKKLLDVASQQMAIEFKAAGKAFEVINPWQSEVLTDLTRQSVDAFVTAQKALLDVVRPGQHAHEARVPHAKETAHKPAAGARKAGQKRTELAHAEPVTA
ncbi:MAG TPA: hypothetical protein VMH81_15315 [Bryobacteraceae bacterium]|nr:hypothetical protein [Bryobacteraceae bacterium]